VKKTDKIEEEELLDLLSENLKSKLIVYLSGGMLKHIPVLGKFPMELLSQISFILQKQTYILGDDIIVEDKLGSELFLILNGRVGVIHKHTKTYIKDLIED
jgi:hypothetical protein